MWRINLLNSLILHFFIRKMVIELSCKHEVTVADDGGCHKAYDPVSDLTGDVSYLFSMKKIYWPRKEIKLWISQLKQ